MIRFLKKVAIFATLLSSQTPAFGIEFSQIHPDWKICLYEILNRQWYFTSPCDHFLNKDHSIYSSLHGWVPSLIANPDTDGNCRVEERSVVLEMLREKLLKERPEKKAQIEAWQFINVLDPLHFDQNAIEEDLRNHVNQGLKKGKNHFGLTIDLREMNHSISAYIDRTERKGYFFESCAWNCESFPQTPLITRVFEEFIPGIVWDFQPIKSAHQKSTLQNPDRNCGIYSIRFLEHLLLGRTVNEIVLDTNYKIRETRKRYSDLLREKFQNSIPVSNRIQSIEPEETFAPYVLKVSGRKVEDLSTDEFLKEAFSLIQSNHSKQAYLKSKIGRLGQAFMFKSLIKSSQQFGITSRIFSLHFATLDKTPFIAEDPNKFGFLKIDELLLLDDTAWSDFASKHEMQIVEFVQLLEHWLILSEFFESPLDYDFKTVKPAMKSVWLID